LPFLKLLVRFSLAFQGLKSHRTHNFEVSLLNLLKIAICLPQTRGKQTDSALAAGRLRGFPGDQAADRGRVCSVSRCWDSLGQCRTTTDIIAVPQVDGTREGLSDSQMLLKRMRGSVNAVTVFLQLDHKSRARDINEKE
jgi:hypothetical protein